jgi:hypothetical protein
LVFINDIGFRSTQNLASALRHLRYEDRPRTIWADAICINQSNVKERNEQVKLMRDIYTRAVKVDVWLGERTEESDKAMDLIEHLAPSGHVHGTRLFNVCRHGRFEEQEPPTREKFEPLRNFFKSDWWHRLWVLQEMALAKQIDFYHGHRILSWQVLKMTIEWIQKHERCCHAFLEMARLLDIMYAASEMSFKRLLIRQRFMEHRGIDLLWLLVTQRCLLCSDPRDKVYGFLGFNSDNIIEPDYHLTVQQVYTQITLAHINSTGSLEVLSHVGRRRRFENLPSWVPDWSQCYSRDHDQIAALEKQEFSASGNTLARIEVSADFLATKGILFDLVECSIDPLIGIDEKGFHTYDPAGDRRRFVSKKRIDEWRSLLGQDRALDRQYVGGGTIGDTFWRALIGDVSSDDSFASTRRSRQSDLDSFNLWLRFIEHDRNPDVMGFTTVEALSTYVPAIQTIHTAFFHAHCDRRPFTTLRGYVGMGNHELIPGDVVCILYGGREPFVLRRTIEGHGWKQDATTSVSGGKVRQDTKVEGDRIFWHNSESGEVVWEMPDVLKEPSEGRKEYFSFLSNAYVHGIMDGEVMANVGPADEEVFLIG